MVAVNDIKIGLDEDTSDAEKLKKSRQKRKRKILGDSFFSKKSRINTEEDTSSDDSISKENEIDSNSDTGRKSETDLTSANSDTGGKSETDLTTDEKICTIYGKLIITKCFTKQSVDVFQNLCRFFLMSSKATLLIHLIYLSIPNLFMLEVDIVFQPHCTYLFICR